MLPRHKIRVLILKNNNKIDTLCPCDNIMSSHPSRKTIGSGASEDTSYPRRRGLTAILEVPLFYI